MLFAFLRFFFSTCCYNKPTGLLLDTLRSELGQKVASQGQPLNKGAHLWLAVLCEGRRHTMMMQETSFRDTLRNLTLEGPAALAKEEVQGGQWWAKSANSRLVLLRAAEQVRPCRAVWGPYRPAVGLSQERLTHRLLQRLHTVLRPLRASRRVCHSSALLSKALTLSWASFNSLRSGVHSCLHLKGGPVTSNAFSEGFALACCSGESQQLQVFFIPQLQTCGALALRDVHMYHMDMGRFCSRNHILDFTVW